MQTETPETPETPKDRRLSELHDELGVVMELLLEEAKCEVDSPSEYTAEILNLSEAIDRMRTAIIGEVMRSHPEYFTQLLNGNWISAETEPAIKN